MSSPGFDANGNEMLSSIGSGAASGATFGPWGAVIGAGVGAAANIWGQSQAEKAARKSEAYNKQRMDQLGSWFNKEYYRNYLDSDAARAGLSRLQTQFKDANKSQANMAVAGGSTPEAVIAQSGQNQKSYADAVTGLVGAGDIRKDQTMYQYKGLMQPLEANQANILAGKANQWNQFGANVNGATSNILNSWANGAFDKKPV